MEENDNKRLPLDYQKYPGKMDHTTCLCFRASLSDIPIWNVVTEMESNLRDITGEDIKVAE